MCGKYFLKFISFVIVKEHEVEKMFTLKSGRVPPADVKNVIFFVRPRLELMDIIVENVFRSVLTVSLSMWFGLYNCSQFLRSLIYDTQWRKAAYVKRLPHSVCSSPKHVVWTAVEGTRCLGLLHQHWRVYPRLNPMWQWPALDGIWKCFQGTFNLDSKSKLFF